MSKMTDSRKDSFLFQELDSERADFFHAKEIADARMAEEALKKKKRLLEQEQAFDSLVSKRPEIF